MRVSGRSGLGRGRGFSELWVWVGTEGLEDWLGLGLRMAAGFCVLDGGLVVCAESSWSCCVLGLYPSVLGLAGAAEPRAALFSVV